MLRTASHTPLAGFTIVELLISILLTSIIMGAIYSVYRVQTHTAKVQEMRQEAQEYARSALDMMVREIRNAGYKPVAVATHITLPPCDDGTNKGVYTATATKFEFRYDIDADGDCGETNERIIYEYNAASKNITRAAAPDAPPDVSVPQSLTDGNVTSFSFRYFKQDGAELTILPVPAADLPNIQRVLITLTVQSKNPDAQFGGQLNAQMTSNADLRNRGLPQ